MRPILGKSDTNIDAAVGYKMLKIYNSNVSTTPHYHEYYEFFLTMTGAVIHLINGAQTLLPPRSLVFIRKNDVHCYKKAGEEFSFLNFALSADIAEPLCAYYGQVTKNILDRKMPPAIQLNSMDYDHIMQQFDSLNAIDLWDTQAHQIKMKMLVTELFSLFIRNELEKNDSSLPVWLNDLLNTARDVRNMGMTLDDMAKVTGMSREHISRSFRKYLHTTASRFMVEQRLNYSANLLLNTDLSILDICYECYFQAPCWFYQKFKEKFGVTPKEFRNRAGV